MLLDLRSELACFPNLGVEIRMCSEVLRLEVVCPDNEDIVLRLLGVLFLDRDVAVERVVVLNAGRHTHFLDEFSHSDDCLGGLNGVAGVVDAARDVTMGICSTDREQPVGNS